MGFIPKNWQDNDKLEGATIQPGAGQSSSLRALWVTGVDFMNWGLGQAWKVVL